MKASKVIVRVIFYISLLSTIALFLGYTVGGSTARHSAISVFAPHSETMTCIKNQVAAFPGLAKFKYYLSYYRVRSEDPLSYRRAEIVEPRYRDFEEVLVVRGEMNGTLWYIYCPRLPDSKEFDLEGMWSWRKTQ